MLFPDDDLGHGRARPTLGPACPASSTRHAADRVLGLEPIDWIGEGLTERLAGKEVQEEAEGKKETMRVGDTRPSHPLGDYAGDYGHPGYGPLRVSLDGERVSISYNGIDAPLEHWHYDVWTGAETEGDPTFEDQKFQFRRRPRRPDRRGRVGDRSDGRPDRLCPAPDARLSDPGYLSRLVGAYELPGQKVLIERSGSALTVTLPGQPRFTLRPALGGRFVLVEVPAIQIGFELDDEGPATAVTFFQPNGVFSAERVDG